VRSLEELVVWQKVSLLTVAVHRATARYPKDERFGLVTQTRRSAVSVAANIAEGCGRRGVREFLRFVDIALGSAYELESHLRIAAALYYLPPDSLESLRSDLDEVKRMLVGLAQSLQRRFR
jgi:four helix bundle protein